MPEDPEDPEDDDVPSEDEDSDDSDDGSEDSDDKDTSEEEEDSEEEEGSEEEEDSEEEEGSEEEEDSEEEEEEEEDSEEEEGSEEETLDEEVDEASEEEDAEEDEDSEEEEQVEEADAAVDEEGEIVLPDLDEEVFGSRDEWDGDDEDFEDDQGDWSADDYHEVATTLFGDHGFFGDTAVQRYIDEGFTPLEEEDHEVVRGVREHLPDATTVRFFERDGKIVPRGFLTSTALELLEAVFPDLDLDFLRVTVPKRPRPAPLEENDGGDSAPPPRGLPPQIANVAPRDSVDLRKYATPVGDQGSTSRCAAFAWTHALEMLGKMHQRPFPRLACSFTMYRFQERQGDLRDFRYAWKGGDGTSGTWEPGAHLFVKGTCRQDHWPDRHKEPLVALEEMEADAQSHTFEADIYDVTLDEMKKLLSAGLPVQISMATGDAFQDIGRDGVMKVAEAPKGQHGYHAMLCVGYVGNYFIVKNSWGDDWGDSGYCYIPKKVLAESEPEAVAIVPRGRMAPPPNMPPPNMTPGGGPPTGGPAPPAASAARGGGGTMMMSAVPAVPPASRARPGTQAIPPMPVPPPPAPPVAQAPVPSLVTCARCAKHVPGGKFCRECGAPLPPPAPPPSTRNFCSNCGARREGAGRFCAGCGAKHE